MSTDLNLFFEALATRAYKENDLSDVTYAMCQSDIVFKKFFLDFFFPNANLNAEDAVFEREHSTDNGRPDFWIRANDKTYIVEVKIWDGNHHFEQYRKILEEENNSQDAETWQYLGYITNYGLADNNVNVKTWEEMYKRLKSYNGFNDPAIIAYMSYIKGVCWFEIYNIEKYTFDPKNFEHIKKISQEIDECIKKTEKNTENIFAYNRSTNFKSKCWMGRHFEFRKFKDEKTIWGFLGITYKDEAANICVSFRDQNGWAKLLCDDYRNQIKTLKPNGAIAYEGSNLVFYMTTEEHDKKALISDFFNSVLNEIKNNQFSRADKKRYGDKENLIAMKKLPLYLERKFFDFDIDTNFNIQLSEYQKDSESPNAYCGRCFELISNDDQTLPIHGWVGALYDSEDPKDPEFVIQIDKNSAISNMLKDKDWKEDRAWKNLIYQEKGQQKLANIEGWFKKTIKDICSAFQKCKNRCVALPEG